MSKTQRIEEKVTIYYEKGLHVRVAATIVQKADRLQNEYNVLYSVHREGLHNVPLTSILLVTALKVKKGEEKQLYYIFQQICINLNKKEPTIFVF